RKPSTGSSAAVQRRATAPRAPGPRAVPQTVPGPPPGSGPYELVLPSPREGRGNSGSSARAGVVTSHRARGEPCWLAPTRSERRGRGRSGKPSPGLGGVPQPAATRALLRGVSARAGVQGGAPVGHGGRRSPRTGGLAPFDRSQTSPQTRTRLGGNAKAAL